MFHPPGATEWNERTADYQGHHNCTGGEGALCEFVASLIYRPSPKTNRNGVVLRPPQGHEFKVSLVYKASPGQPVIVIVSK